MSRISLPNEKLIPQMSVNCTGKDWHRIVYSNIEARLDSASHFPCVFSKNAFRKQLLKFIFVENTEALEIQHLADGLVEYVEISKGWDGQFNSAYPLIVAFSMDAVNAKTVDSYHAFGWKVLQKLHEIDPAPWPKKIPKDPNLPSWSMCFNGMPIFCNMSHPAHQIRRSRNLGEHFMLIINPRERFDVFAGDTTSGRKARANIRDRISAYDKASHCTQLANYDDGGIEWQQYGIIEDNVVRTDKCPFRFSEHQNG